MLASEAMWKAAGYVEAGWCQNNLQDHQGNVCALGALNRACYGVMVVSMCYQALRSLLQEQGWSYGDVVAFNNHPSTTQQDVVNVMQKVAARLAEEGN